MATGLGLEFESSCGQVPLGSATPDIGGRLIGTPPHFLFLFTLLLTLDGSLFNSHWTWDSRLMPLRN
jgi:hypothetical protein